MKKLRTLALISTMIFAVSEALCSTALISVELPNMESKKAWHQLGIPTYELIGNSAIAEAEESQIGQLKQRGYQVNIIDHQPDLSEYSVVSKTDMVQAQHERLIWQNSKAAIVKPAPKSSYFDREYKHNIRYMNNKPLGEKFWKSVTTKYAPLKNIPYDPFIQSLVDQVNTDTIVSYIQRLQGFKTRFVVTDSNYAASVWISQKLSDWGYIVNRDTFSLDTFYINGNLWAGSGSNVIGMKPGTNDSTKDIIACGHFDTDYIAPIYGSGDTDMVYTCPGADDNASGTAGMMEAARIFKYYSWKANNYFIGFDAEEVGLIGSRHYAKQADSSGRNIEAVINNDMIGALAWDSTFSGDVSYFSEFNQWLSELYISVSNTYVPSITLLTESLSGGSDHYSFDRYGYNAVMAIQDEYSYCHDLLDSLSQLSPELLTAFTKSTLAVMATLNIHPAGVNDIAALDIGSGSELQVTWSRLNESGVTGYYVFWGLESGLYNDSIYTVNVSDTITGLLPDSLYYMTVRAIDGDGKQSLRAEEISAIPRSAPLRSENVTATPVTGGIRIDYNKNVELDLVGYRIYRSIDSTWSYDSLNVALITDTSYTDQPLSGANRYYYKVRSFDEDGNCSSFSDSVYGRPITLDQGILIVDETNNWTTGSFPRDAQQDSFYNYILAGYKYEPYEYGYSAQKPILADLGPYSTVAWLADDYATFLASGAAEGIEAYLDNGGKMWFAGWRPSSNVGISLFDELKISASELSGTTDSFKMALGLKGYPDIPIDTLKYPSTIWGKTFRNIEALTPLAGADTIYAIDMKNNGSPYEGRACAVRDSGKTVFFGFPLYFMDKEQAKAAAQKVLAEFGEVPLGVAGKPENKERIAEVRLLQNAPNPFKHQTSISYQLPKSGMVTLNIYNIAGQLVKTLINGEHQSGSYTVKWDGRDRQNRQSSAGVYIYHLIIGDQTQSRKMIVLK